MVRNSESEESISNPQIPPPKDPFPTYQSSYPRHTSQFDDQNPFIHFRRFADSQIASLLAALPTFFGTFPKRVENDGRKHYTQADFSEAVTEADQLLKARVNEFERKLLEEMNTRHSEAEGFWKKAEQEWEERRIENENRLKGEVDKWSKLMHSEEQHSDSRSQCETELDLYDRQSATTASAPAHQHHFSAQKGGSFPPSRLQSESYKERDEQSNEIGAICPTSADLDPSRNEAHALGWWLRNEYSPLRLKRPSKNEDQARMSTALDWEAAFNDLLESSVTFHQSSTSHNQTEESVWSDNLLNTSGTARLVDDGIGMLAKLKSDFSNWGLGALGMPEMSSLEDHKASWISQLDHFLGQNWKQVRDQFGNDVESGAVNNRKDDADPCSSLSAPTLEKIQEVANHEGDEQPDSSKQHTVWSSSSVTTNNWSSPKDDSPNSILSTLTTIQTRTRADGSVETKRILKKKFADGTEEKNESVQVYPARTPMKAISLPTQQDEDTKYQPEGALKPNTTSNENQRIGKGWFWN